MSDGQNRESSRDENAAPKPTADEVIKAWRDWFNESAPELNMVDDVEAAIGRKGDAAMAEEWRTTVRRVIDNRIQLTERIAELDMTAARLSEALTKCAGMFDRYAEIHRMKGPGHEHKAADNAGMALMCRVALGVA